MFVLGDHTFTKNFYVSFNKVNSDGFRNLNKVINKMCSENVEFESSNPIKECALHKLEIGWQL